MNTIIIVYDPKRCGVEDGGDLFGYLRNELDNGKIVCHIAEVRGTDPNQVRAAISKGRSAMYGGKNDNGEKRP